MCPGAATKLKKNFNPVIRAFPVGREETHPGNYVLQK
jgi:hypothetical protein